MHDLSFDPRDPRYSFAGWTFSVEIFTYENRYGLRPDACVSTGDAQRFALECQGLTWAGGQEQAPGRAAVRAEAKDDAVTVRVEAGAAHTIRCVKLVLHDLPLGAVVGLRESDALEIPPEGLRLAYPSGWRGLATPLLALRTAEGIVYARSLDTQVREKRFAVLRRGDRLQVELIFEELATEQGQAVSVPAWELGVAETLDELMATQTAHVAAAYGLLPWERRPDVPAWARRIGLVAAVHCQHWTGYVFNSYAKVLERTRWLAERFDPTRTLLYLPGWEGRYYWQYGDYRPDPRMGGEAGFAALVRGAQDLGVRVMPMFGINVVNQGLDNFEQWGAPARFGSAGGFPTAGSVDWDGSRHHDHGWGVLLNPGAPTWQRRLAGQIVALAERYGFDGAFLDISAGWWNDPRHPVYPGTLELIARIRGQRPGLLIAGEGWYDGIGAATPLMQSGHTEGALHWHDQPYGPLFDTSCRSFAHLCLGDPGRGSTGVHELGTNGARRSPLRKGIIPTLTIVEDSLEVAPEGAEAVLADARSYVARYLADLPE